MEKKGREKRYFSVYYRKKRITCKEIVSGVLGRSTSKGKKKDWVSDRTLSGGIDQQRGIRGDCLRKGIDKDRRTGWGENEEGTSSHNSGTLSSTTRREKGEDPKVR